MSDFQIRSIGDVADDVERSGDLEGSEYLRNQMDDDIKQCMVDVLKVALSPILSSSCTDTNRL